jgi:ABC-2 type transport system ATP-binding protein
MERDVVQTRALAKNYGAFAALRGIDLAIERGEILGFLGPNGAGKTTTIRLLLGLLRPSAGEARVLGLDCWRDAVAIKRRIGYLPGDVRFYDSLTGRRFLELLAGLRNVPTRYDELAERLGLDLSRRIKAYSKGMKQKLGLIQAVMHSPELVILDEPTSGLDPLIQEEVYEILREVNAAGASIFFSSHVLSEVEKVCHRVAVVREGRLLRVGSVDQLGDFTRRRVTVVSEQAESLAAQLRSEGHVPEVHGDRVTLIVLHGLDVLPTLMGYPMSDLRIEALSLEEMFLDVYRSQDASELLAPGGGG